MRRAARAEPRVFYLLTAGVLVIAALPRLIAVAYGLPQVYNADEPHVVNIAVSLAGSLRPFSFKYPTLWPMILAAAYGIWFVFWSGFGLLRGTLDFAARYAFAPTGFFLIARLLATASQLLALVIVAREERAVNKTRWAYGAFVLAVAPTLVELAHASKPDSLMFLFGALATTAALQHQREGTRGPLLFSGLFAGLMCSTQYTAAPSLLMVPLAWILCTKRPGPLRWLFQAGLLAVVGFAAGTPYAFIEPGRFAADLAYNGELGKLLHYDAWESVQLVAKNIFTFGGEGSLVGLAALIGFFQVFGKDAKRALLLGLPIVGYFAVLSASFNGGVSRYLVGAYPFLALLAGEGFSWLAGDRAWRRALVVALAVAPGLFLSWRQDAELSHPDTRAQATQWLAAAVAPGQTLLLDQPHAGPLVVMEKEQCLELAARAEKNGSPRARLFRAMAQKHPGGGYRIFRIQRAAKDLWSSPRHVAESQADGDFLDVRPGLDTARAARVDWVVTSSYGADPRRVRELATFFNELSAQAEFVREFPSQPGVTTGPWLRVWHLRR